MVQRRLPLSRFFVLDLTHARSGPTAVRHLADWGAQVVHIERPTTDAKEEAVAGRRDGFDYQNLHRNKRSITLDLKSEAGRKVFLQLVERADVLVENMRAAVKYRLGIDYEALRKVNPRLVYGSISGYGQDGPYADRPGYDQVAQGIGGLMSITGLPGQGPVRVGVPISDLTAGGFLAQAILIALLDREVTGEGCWVHTSLIESVISLLDLQAARWLVDREVPGQAGNNHPTGAPTGVFPTADGFMNIAAPGELMWKRLSTALGATHFLSDEGFRTNTMRVKNRERLNDQIGEITKTQPTSHWVAVLNGAGVPCGPILTVDQVFADPQVQHLHMAKAVVHPRLGELSLVAPPINIGGVTKELSRPSPDLGEHTREVLQELGYDDNQVESLKAAGAI